MYDTSIARTAAVEIVELGTEHETVDLSAADSWYVVLTSSGQPVLRVESPSPAGTPDSGLVELLLSRPADPVMWRRNLTAELRRAFTSAPEEYGVRPTVSVVVCTHRRPQHLPFLLDALDRLDPAPDEVVVVDNDPGDADCREIVERSGARYVREDRRGQDNARNAGLAVASGDVLAFTDDDCVPAPDWLAYVGENFADPLVAVSTGPGFPWALDTPAQERIERQGGFMRGLDRRLLDWRVLPPIHAGAAGAGANLLVRRSTLAGLEAPWPPEMGPGTPTESGDDTYVLARFLAAGYRIVYDPRQWFQHQHRADWAALRKAVGGYGVGSMCMLLKSLTEDGETEAPQGLTWIWRQYVRTQWRRVLGHADGVEMMIAVDYLRGAAAGPRRLRAARRAYAQEGGRPEGLRLPAPREAVVAGTSRPPGTPRAVADLSVVVALDDGADAAPCLRALAAGTACPAEVITVGPGTASPAGADRHVSCAPGDGAEASWRAGAAVATAPAVLLLRASMTPDRALVAAHARQHESGADVVVGRCHALPGDDTLASSWAALESREHAAGPRALASTWSGTSDGNVSVAAAALATAMDRAGGTLDVEDVVRRVAAAGGRIVHDASATATVLVRASVEDLVGEGSRALALLPVLERLRQRRLWARLLRREMTRTTHRIPSLSRSARLDLVRMDLPARDAETPDRLDVVLGDRRLGSVLLVDEPDPQTLAARVTDVLDRAPDAWEELAIARGWTREAPEAGTHGPLALLAPEVDESVAALDVEVAGLPEDDVLGRVRETARRLDPGTGWLVVVAPGLRVERRLLDDVAPALAGDRVGCVYGSRSESPLGRALSVGTRLTPAMVRWDPVDYVAVRASVAAGLTDAEVTRAGTDPRGALLVLAERAAQTAWLVGRLDARGLQEQYDGALRARPAAHRTALGWWLGARVRTAPARRARRIAGTEAALEVAQGLRRRWGTGLALRGMRAGLR